MSDPIYLIGENRQAVPLYPTQYAKEEEFQDLLAEFPALLAGEQVDRDAPRQWLHVAKEIGIPDSEATGPRWQLDHLFVDQDRVPTFVEVKRQSDTRLRREVVGQVLDYAANASRYWTADYLHERFRETCAKLNADPDQTLRTFLASEAADLNQFWADVHGKLVSGDMRLMFVADSVPTELQRIVEFLNNQMNRTEVLAVEVKRYVGGGFSTHVPRLLGQTSEALEAKATAKGSSRRKWTAEEFFNAAEAAQPATVVDAIRRIYTLGQEDGFEFRLGTGTSVGSLNVVVPALTSGSVVTAQTNGVLKLNFGWLPPPTADALCAFARAEFGYKPGPNWQKTWPEFSGEAWAKSVGRLTELLRSLRPEKG